MATRKAKKRLDKAIDKARKFRLREALKKQPDPQSHAAFDAAQNEMAMGLNAADRRRKSRIRSSRK